MFCKKVNNFTNNNMLRNNDIHLSDDPGSHTGGVRGLSPPPSKYISKIIFSTRACKMN